jgi:hypothetical protein
MKANISQTDRAIRIIIGAVILLSGIWFKSWFGVIGILPIVTGLLNYCPAYNLIGVKTKSKIKTDKL